MSQRVLLTLGSAVLVTRRAVLGAGMAAAAAAVAGTAATAAAIGGCSSHADAWKVPEASLEENTSPSPSTHDDPIRRVAACEPDLIATLKRFLSSTPENPGHPAYAGAVIHLTVNGADPVSAAVGDALRYSAGPTELPPANRVAMRTDSVFDLASITKIFTAMLVLQQVDRGLVDLAAPVVSYLPEFTGPGKESITVAMLLSHTGGLPDGAKITGQPGAAGPWAAILATPLAAGAVPGDAFRYSSIGTMVLGLLVEKVTGLSLDRALEAGLTGPLGLNDTRFRPTRSMSPADQAARLVATDARSSRGLLRGVVHDDVANLLGGVAGHAGLFSTAADLNVIGQLLLDGGQYGGKQILARETVSRMLTNVNHGLPNVDLENPGRTSDHGLGVMLNQQWMMGPLTSPLTFGHTGFTGTALIVCRERRLVLVLLTNRAHPDWSWSEPAPPRLAVAKILADALA